MSRIVPFLTFQPGRGQSAAAAMDFYVTLFADGSIVSDVRHGPDGPGPEGSVQVAEFSVAGQVIRCSDSFITHDWNFSPAVSLWVDFADTDEQRRVFDGLAADGTPFMPLDDYGFGTFGWVEDRFGVSWQLALSTS
ncbi:VOC family protein [Williamsia sterculiae]|uniref:Glyoxalase superfamily enzyme, possibly 3-demethylubiquinone-9 3-methyltransferase n=1 Tax=Williamsia sterculiae TaxID=1344003 RepID=A0A1N7GZ19_9NOCA|nr:VOC family protein [Williamsia sterculiae]SIS17839.1 Glyoxalase superfamily enzyme, possibly 3-demethylubiquinone-9 3-methyltransferase [Williamsia sterculiae]